MVVFVNINSIVTSRDIIVNAISIDLELSASISGRREPKVPIPKAIIASVGDTTLIDNRTPLINALLVAPTSKVCF